MLPPIHIMAAAIQNQYVFCLLITDPDISDLRSALSPVGARASEHNTEISVKSSLQLLIYYTTILNIYRVDKFELRNGQYLF